MSLLYKSYHILDFQEIISKIISFLIIILIIMLEF